MCTVCGCSEPTGEAHSDGHGSHGHEHDSATGPGRAVDFAAGSAGATPVTGSSQARTLAIQSDILAENEAYAAANRARLAEAGVLALNLMSGPGAGKTSLLVRMIADLRRVWPIAVIEGDHHTSCDAERIRAAGAEAVQINTGKGCHLDADMVGRALDSLPLGAGGLLFIENVGNLVCPAAFDLGEASRLVVLSITEGEDKPLKYPNMFASADVVVINKVDLLPHLDFDMDACLDSVWQVNPRADVLAASARTGEGLPALYAWIASAAVVDGVLPTGLAAG